MPVFMWGWGGMCFWLMFVLILKSFVSPTCCMTWRRVKEENGGYLLNLHQTTWPDILEYPCVPRRRTQRPQLLQGHLGGYRGSGDLAQLRGCLASSDASTPGPQPLGLCTRIIGLHGCGKGAKEGLGGTSGFSEGCASAPTSSVSCRH